MKLEFASVAQKDIKKLDKTTQKQIIKKLNFYINQPDPLKYAAKLTGFSGGGYYRFRVGSYRAVFDVSKNTISVLYIEHRREIYRKR